MKSNSKILTPKEEAWSSAERRWRLAALQLYYLFLALVGIMLIIKFPPHFDRNPSTVAAVAFVAIFLAIMERPVRAAGISAAPLTSIIGASVILFGWWTLVLTTVTWAAIHLRQRQPLILRWLMAFASQIGIGFIAVYAMVPTWNFIHRLAERTTSIENVLITLFGTLFVASLSQVVNNTLLYPATLLVSQPFPLVQLFRVGLLASLYAYMFVALYSFGGIITAALFYVVLAQHRIVTEAMGITATLQKLDRAREQARNLVADLMHFRDTGSASFGSEVQTIAQRIGRRLGMSRTEVAMLGLAAELHEIGMARLSPKLRQSDNLGSVELEQLKTYPRIGAHMIREADALLPTEIADWIEGQGEHFDGSGYPRGLTGHEIPLQSRIIALARDYVAFASNSGAAVGGKENALAKLRERAGTVYDPELISTLTDII